VSAGGMCVDSSSQLGYILCNLVVPVVFFNGIDFGSRNSFFFLARFFSVSPLLSLTP